MNTIKELRTHNGKKFKRTISKNKACLEDWPEIKKDALKLGYTENKNGNLYKDNSTLIKPRIYRETIGTINFRSKDYTFTYIDPEGETVTSYGDTITKNMLSSEGFILDAGSFKIYYSLINS